MSYFQNVRHLLLDLGCDIILEEPNAQIFIVSDETRGMSNMLLSCEGDILTIEQIIVAIRQEDPEHFKRLLQMNRSLVHGAFVLNSSQEDFEIVAFRDTLQLPNLDPNELEASLNALTLALMENLDELLVIGGENGGVEVGHQRPVG
jgi:hypothetical protein